VTANITVSQIETDGCLVLKDKKALASFPVISLLTEQRLVAVQILISSS
jgi:hypothetical protein